MADRLLVEVVRNLTDMNRGDRALVDDGPGVRGMVDSGNWRIIRRETQREEVTSVPDHDQSE